MVNVKVNVLYIRLVYKLADKIKKTFLGSIEGSFKKMFYNHKTIFAHAKYEHSIALSKHVWDIENKYGVDLILNWDIVKRARKYKAGGGFRLLWIKEKLTIATYPSSKELLNQISEILNGYRHKNKRLFMYFVPSLCKSLLV